jgi:hypothetical protein
LSLSTHENSDADRINNGIIILNLISSEFK